ncbi:MAG: dihydroorotase [Trueperaceae bacterium]
MTDTPNAIPRTVLRGARLIDAHGDHGVHDLWLAGGTVEGIDLQGDADLEVDARGLVATPAFLDPHVHLRVPGQEEKEDLATGLGAAVAGGFGTVVSMANTTPTVDDAAIVADLVAQAARLGLARLRPAAALSIGLKGERLADYAALQAAGAVMITDDGIPVADAHLQRRACEYAFELGLVVQTHSEEPSLRQGGVMHEGRVSIELGLPGNPAEAEAVMLYRDGMIARMTGCRVHLAHVSSELGMRAVEALKELGAPVTVEVTPHHLTLTDEVLRAFDPVFKVAPPLREASDVAYLIDAVNRGVVDCLGTDHAPHTRAEKDRDLLEAPFGLPNIEVAFPLLYTRLVATGQVTLARLLELMQAGPARVMGWTEPTLAAGMPADVVLLDLEAQAPVDPAAFASKAKFSPWAGEVLTGWPRTTLVGGRLVYERPR